LSIKDNLYGPTSVNFNYFFAAVRVVLCRTITKNHSFYTILYIFNSLWSVSSILALQSIHWLIHHCSPACKRNSSFR